MSPRLIDATKFAWYLLVLYIGPSWSPIQCAAVKTPPKTPSTIEAQAKFFQYRHLPTSEDFDQGHRQGSERHFTERHERSRPSEGLFSAKVRWGDKKGGYGEHYWDLNHAGHGNDHGDNSYNDNSDDGSYHHDDTGDHGDHTYDRSDDHLPTYGDDYDPEKSSYEESGRAKRAHTKTKVERRPYREDQHEEPKRKRKEQKQEEPAYEEEKTSYSGEEESDEEVYKKPKRHHHAPSHEEERPKKEAKNQLVLVVKGKNENQQDTANHGTSQQETSHQGTSQQGSLNHGTPYQGTFHQGTLQQSHPGTPQQQYQDFSQFVPYEGGAGVRQHQPQYETAAATSVPRLFLEPTTGHVVDRATGQAYVLQPVAAPNNYN